MKAVQQQILVIETKEPGGHRVLPHACEGKALCAAPWLWQALINLPFQQKAASQQHAQRSLAYGAC